MIMKMTNACLVKLLSLEDFGYTWLSQDNMNVEYFTLLFNGFIEVSSSFNEENGTLEQKMYVLSNDGKRLIKALLAIANLGLS